MKDEMKQFIKVFYRVLDTPELKTSAEKLIYSIIYSFPNGKYSASLKWLANKAGVGSVDTLQKYLKQMVLLGLLQKEKVNGRKVIYRIGRVPLPNEHSYASEEADVIAFLMESGQF